VQNNAMSGLSGEGVMLFSCAESLTVRDNNIYGCDGGRIYVPSTTLFATFGGRLYRNNIYRTNGQASGSIIELLTSTWTQPQQITDNVIYDTEVTAKIVALIAADHAASLIDRNQYYAPSDADTPDKAWFDNATAKTFAEWQALGFDVNGSVADPGWTDPANGDFS